MSACGRTLHAHGPAARRAPLSAPFMAGMHIERLLASLLARTTSMQLSPVSWVTAQLACRAATLSFACHRLLVPVCQVAHGVLLLQSCPLQTVQFSSAEICRGGGCRSSLPARLNGAVGAALLAALRMLGWLDPALVKPVLTLALTSKR